MILLAVRELAAAAILRSDMDQRLIDCMRINIQNNRDDIDHLMNCTKFDDAYWLRYFAAAAMQGMMDGEGFSEETISPTSKVTYLQRGVGLCVRHAEALLAEIKRVEGEGK
jgi:hypothetical protein